MTLDADATASKYLTLVEVSRAIASYRDLSELSDALSECLHRLLTFNYLSVVLYQRATNTMRLHVLHSTARKPESVGQEYPLEGSFSGMVWQTQQALNIRDLTKESRFPEVLRLLRQHHVRSFCSLPLTTAHRRIGALAIGRSEHGGYGETELEFAKLVAAQVAVAFDNALHYQEGIDLQQAVQKERDRLQLVLDVNNSVVSISSYGTCSRRCLAVSAAW